MGCGTSSTSGNMQRNIPGNNWKQKGKHDFKDSHHQSDEVKDPDFKPKAVHINRENNNMGSSSNIVTILHFNDVYNIEPRDQEPVGGAARFRTAIKQRAHLNPMVLFSGDAFSPSLMSTVTQGKQMVPVLNKLGIQCACYGNHDFDFGVDSLVTKAKQSTFPWLISNVYDNETENPLAEGATTCVIEWQGYKFGILGLVESEWIATLSTIDAEDVTFIDFVEEGRRLAKELREEGADYIIALTHMRWPNDEKLAQNVEEIDLILGGHDHDYNIKQVNGRYVIKSGTDFQNMCQVTLTFHDGKVDVDTKEVIIDSSIEEDEEVKAIVNEYMGVFQERMEKELGVMETELDGRFNQIRTKETNLGNFITDIMLESTEADVALLNSGTLRSDRVHPKGTFKMKDLMAILPIVDPIVVIKVSGKQLVEALENGVSKYPALEGRFPQVSGVKFGFDPDKEPGSRIDPKFVQVGDDYLDLEKTDYRLCVKQYIANGKDGYDVLKNCEVIVNEEEGPRLSTSVMNHFKSCRIMKGEKKPKYSHHQSIIPVTRRKSLVHQQTIHCESPTPRSRPALKRQSSVDLHDKPVVTRSVTCFMTTPRSSSRSLSTLERRQSISDMEKMNINHALAPEVEGRIFILTNETREEEEEKLKQHLNCKNLLATSITELDEAAAE